MAESSIVEFEERLIIHAPANVVERMLVDAPALPQWRTCMRENVETSDPIMRPGTTVTFVTTQYGLHFDYIQIVPSTFRDRRWRTGPPRVCSSSTPRTSGSRITGAPG